MSETNSGDAAQAPKYQYHALALVKNPADGKYYQQPVEITSRDGGEVDGIDEGYARYYFEYIRMQNKNVVGLSFFRTEHMFTFEVNDEQESEAPEIITFKRPEETPYVSTDCSNEHCSNTTQGIFIKEHDKNVPICDECWEQMNPGVTPVRHKREPM